MILDLTIHCKSKEDDLGEHLLRSGMVFKWTFKPNFWGATQYYCSFQWRGGNLKWFDIYIEKRDDDYTLCSWSIKQEGPCFLEDPSKIESRFDKWKCYPWNNSN